MTIISILAIYAIPRFTDTNALSVRGYHDELVAATRYAQRYAVASGCTIRIQINANDYSLTTQDADCGFGTPVQGPTGETFIGNAPDDVDVTDGLGDHAFDAMGNLVSGGGTVEISGDGSVIDFTINASGFVSE